MSVEDLLTVHIDSVYSSSKFEQKVTEAPASVTIVSAEEIQKFGYQTLADVLRDIRGFYVTYDRNYSYLGFRGYSQPGDYNSRVQLLVDGHLLNDDLYDQALLGTEFPLDLDLIDRIEVVRGPGAVMWGPNAVNGVINIITKSAGATKGASVSAAAGNELRGALGGRWSVAPSDHLAFRTWGKLEDRQPAFGSLGYYNYVTAFHAEPSVTNLNWESGRIGFRMDAQVQERDQLMVEGDIYKMGRQDRLDYPVLLPQSIDSSQAHSGAGGASLYSRWTHTSSTGSESMLQLSLHRSNADYPFVGGTLANLNVDFQNRRLTGENNEIYWGAGFQQFSDNIYGSRGFGLNPPDIAMEMS